VAFTPIPVKDAANPSNAGTFSLNGANLIKGDDTVALFAGTPSCTTSNGSPALSFSASECTGDGASATKLVCPFVDTLRTLSPGTYTACLCDKSATGDCSVPAKFTTQPSTTSTITIPSLTAAGAKLWWEKDADSQIWNTHLLVNTTTLQPSEDQVRLVKWSTGCGNPVEDSDISLEIADCEDGSDENKLVCHNIQVPAGDWRVCMCDKSADHDCTQAQHYTVASTTKVNVPVLAPTRAEASSRWLVTGTTILQSISVWGENFDPTHDKLGLVKITDVNKAAPCDGSQSLEQANIPCNLREGEWGVKKVACGPVPEVTSAGTFALCMCDGNAKVPIQACGSVKGHYKTLIPDANVTYVAAATVAAVKKVAGKANAGLRAMYEITGENLDPMRDRIVAIQESETCGSNASTVQGISPGSLTEWTALTCNAGPDFVDTSSSRRLRRLNDWNSDSSGDDWSSDSSGSAWTSGSSGSAWTSGSSGDNWSDDAKNGKVIQCPIVLSEGKAKFCVCDYSVHGSCAKLEHFSMDPGGGKMVVETGPGNELLAPGFDPNESGFKVLKSPDGEDRFGMAWNFIDDWLYVGVRAETSGYISVAFGESALMSGADSVVGWIDEAGIGMVKAYKLRASDNQDPGGDMSDTEKRSAFLNTTSVSREGKFMTLTFRRKVSDSLLSRRRTLSTTGNDVHVSNKEEETNILWAVSSEGLSANRLPSHSPNDRGAVAINLASGAVTEVSATAQWMSLYVLGACLLGVALSGVILVRVVAVRRSFLGHACLQKTVGNGTSCRCGSKLPSIIYQDLNPVNWFLTLGIGEFMAFVVVIGASIVAYVIDTGSTVVYLSPLRSTGKLVGMFGVLTVLSITRSFSLFLMIFGVPFERAVKWHRGLAKIFVLLTFVHFLCHALPQGIPATLDMAVFGGAEAVPLFGTLSFLAELLIIVTSLEAVRRNYFEVFYFLHYACFLSMMVFSILHVQKFKSPSQLVFVGGMGAAILLWLVDLIVRSTCAAPKVESCRAVAVAGITKLTVKFSKPREIGPGDYFFLSLPDVSKSQVHPFSVSSQPAPDQITFHIKQMGQPFSFTGKLRSLVQQRAGRGQTSLNNVSLSGPYGRFSVRLEDYDELWLIAGGIGITPMISTALHLESILTNGAFTNYADLKKVHLVWSVRSADELAWFDEELARLAKAQSDHKMQLHLYVTRYSKMERKDSVNVAYNAGSGVEMTGSVRVKVVEGSNPMISEKGVQHKFERDKRPSYASLFEDSAGGRVAVMACGPPPLVANVESCAAEKGFHFHKETFLF
jgi:predicted ferric reductase